MKYNNLKLSIIDDNINLGKSKNFIREKGKNVIF